MTQLTLDGNLEEKIQQKIDSKTSFTSEEVLKMLTQIAVGLKIIHSNKLMHRDLKTGNIFLMKNEEVKIGDFGISKILSHSSMFTQSIVGTLEYMAPEIRELKPYNYKADIWALGVILYRMCTLEYYTSEQKNIQAIDNYDPKIKSILVGLLQPDPEKRIELDEILDKLFQNDNNKKDQLEDYECATKEEILEVEKDFEKIDELVEAALKSKKIKGILFSLRYSSNWGGKLNETIKLHNITELGFKFELDIEESIFKSIKKVMEESNSLKKFELKIERCYYMDSKTLKMLAQHLSRLTELQNLDIYLGGATHFNDEAIDLFNALGSLNKLRHLYLNLRAWTSMTSDKLYVLAKILDSKVQLKTLNLGFSTCRSITNSEISLIIKSLKSLSKLQKFAFQLDFCDKTNELCLIEIFNLISQTTITNYRLHLNYPAYDSANFLTKQISLKPDLKKLELELWDIRDCGDAAATYTDMIPDPQNLRVEAHRYLGFSDQNLLNLGVAIAGLEGLESLTLKLFKYFDTITNVGVEGFFKLIENKKSIKNLNLGLYNCMQFTAEGIQKFLKILNKMDWLVRVELLFGCMHIYDKDVEAIYKCIKSLKGLEFTRVLLDTTHVGDKWKKILKEELNSG